MKKILAILVLFISTFAFINTVSASTDKISLADTLQPASAQVINDELQVLGTARAYSIRIGAQGYGGVTFFNGTIINETTDVSTGAEQPVTFGDDIRVDGRIWRGKDEGAGLNDNMPLIVNDDMEVVGDLTVNNLLGTGVVNSANILNGSVATEDIASNAITSAKINNGAVATEDLAGGAVTSAKINNGAVATEDLAGGAVTSGKIKDGTITGSDVSSSADLSVNNINTTGNINQSRTKFGAIKAQVFVQEDGNCTTYTEYNWTYNNTPITCAFTDALTGEYTLTFQFNAAERLATATHLGTVSKTVSIMPNTTNKKQYMIYAHDSAGAASTANFSFFLY